MQLRLRSWLTGVALLAGALAPVALPSAACAAGSAALVVATGSDTYTYCVDLGGSSTNGIGLIQKANDQHGLQYKLGYGGKAVCMLANVGASGNDCFGKHPYFWGLWRGDGAGGWNWSGMGAADVAVDPGDIQGWSWGTGDSGSSHPPPPQATYESVCGVAPSPKPVPSKTPDEPRKGGGGSGKGPGSGSSGGSGPPDAAPPPEQPGGASTGPVEPGDDGTSEGNRKKNRERREGDTKGAREEVGPSASPSASPTPVTTPVTSSDPARAQAPDAGAPATAFVALGAAAALGVAGAVLVRRRRTTG